MDDLSLIKALKERVKKHETVERLFDEYGVDIDFIDYIPIAYKDDLEVSARTDHGIIYLNNKLKKDAVHNDHYLIHEMTHWLQQCFGEKPTTGGGSEGEDYVKNKYEVEGFQNQVEYISDMYGENKAEEYVDKVLDHHELEGKERKNRKDVLLQLAGFESYAAFLSKKQLREKEPGDFEAIDVAYNILENKMGNKASKYFGITYDYIKRLPGDFFYKVSENINDCVEVYKLFEKLQSQMQKKDINQYSNFEELREAVNTKLFEIQKKRVEETDRLGKVFKKDTIEDNIGKSLISGDNTKIYEDNEHVVYRINSKSGANAIGSDTTWCITKMHWSYYEQYTSSNLIFYFAIDKTLPVNDRYQKMAIRVMRDVEDPQRIIDIKCTSKFNDGDHREPTEVPGWELFKDKIIADAQEQPMSLLSKVMAGQASGEEFKKLWDSWFLAGLDEKTWLYDHLPYDYTQTEEVKDFRDTNAGRPNDKFKDITWLEKQPASTIEAVVYKYYNSNFDKLIKLHYPGVDKAIAYHTVNVKTLTQLAFSPNNDIRKEVAKNRYATENILYHLAEEDPKDGVTYYVAKNTQSPKVLDHYVDNLIARNVLEDADLYFILNNDRLDKNTLIKIIDNESDPVDIIDIINLNLHLSDEDIYDHILKILNKFDSEEQQDILFELTRKSIKWNHEDILLKICEIAGTQVIKYIAQTPNKDVSEKVLMCIIDRLQKDGDYFNKNINHLARYSDKQNVLKRLINLSDNANYLKNIYETISKNTHATNEVFIEILSKLKDEKILPHARKLVSNIMMNILDDHYLDDKNYQETFNYIKENYRYIYDLYESMEQNRLKNRK